MPHATPVATRRRGPRTRIMLVAVLIAGVVKASGGFSDTGIAEAVVKKLKGAITGVGE